MGVFQNDTPDHDARKHFRHLSHEAVAIATTIKETFYFAFSIVHCVRLLGETVCSSVILQK